MIRRPVLAALCALLCAPAFAAGKSRKKSSGPARHISSDKAFSYALPRGYVRSRADRRAAAGWTDPWGGAISVSAISASQARKWYGGKALKAARKTRAARAKGEAAKTLKFGKTLKKTLKNGLVYYFFTHRSKKNKSSKPKVTGFMNVGERLYRVEGALGGKGLNAVYWILESVKPVKRPKKKRSFDKGTKPSALREHEEENAGVPLY